jgi:hypothetical protein
MSMKKILSLSLLALLGACSTTPSISTSFSGMHYTSAPTSKDDPRLGKPSFYRDEGDNAWWTHASNPGVN